eukprot:m.98018 g.98018  ORF g.98018 m.98018 type:complete len:210 (-) comp14851_c0_seq1:275-904(-)
MALSEEMACLFPSPPLKLKLQWDEVGTSHSLDYALCRGDHVAFITDPSSVKAVATKASWVLAASARTEPSGEAKIGAIFGSSSALLLQENRGGKDQVMHSDKRLVPCRKVHLIDKAGIARANRAICLYQVVASNAFCDLNLKQHSQTCLDDFKAVLASSQPISGFSPQVLLATAIQTLRNATHATNSTTACWSSAKAVQRFLVLLTQKS